MTRFHHQPSELPDILAGPAVPSPVSRRPHQYYGRRDALSALLVVEPCLQLPPPVQTGRDPTSEGHATVRHLLPVHGDDEPLPAGQDLQTRLEAAPRAGVAAGRRCYRSGQVRSGQTRLETARRAGVAAGDVTGQVRSGQVRSAVRSGETGGCPESGRGCREILQIRSGQDRRGWRLPRERAWLPRDVTGQVSRQVRRNWRLPRERACLPRDVTGQVRSGQVRSGQVRTDDTGGCPESGRGC